MNYELWEDQHGPPLRENNLFCLRMFVSIYFYIDLQYTIYKQGLCVIIFIIYLFLWMPSGRDIEAWRKMEKQFISLFCCNILQVTSLNIIFVSRLPLTFLVLASFKIILVFFYLVKVFMTKLLAH